MAAVMVLMPRMVKILMEGLLPVSESAREWLNKRFGDRKISIGLDAAVALGHPAVISTALILVPITIVIAVILPGNAVLPFGDLATIPFIVAFIVGAARGNIVHSVIVGTIMIGTCFYTSQQILLRCLHKWLWILISICGNSAIISGLTEGGIISYTGSSTNSLAYLTNEFIAADKIGDRRSSK